MFEIHVYTTAGKEKLELSPNTVISLEETTPWFDLKLRLGTFSLPFEIPWTEQNRKILGGVEILERAGAQRFWEVDVYENGIKEISGGKLEFLQHNGSFSYKSGKSIGTISGGESLYGKAIKGKTLRNLALGGIIQWDPTLDARGFANLIMHGDNPYPFCFAPLHCEGYIDENRPDFTTEFLAEDIVNNIVLNPIYPDGWTFGRPWPPNPTLAITSGTGKYNDHATVPFFMLVYVLKRCFEEFGYRITSDIFENEDYTSIFLYNNRRLERPSGSNTDGIRYMIPQQHVPDIMIGEFLEAVCNLLNLALFYIGDKNYKIIRRTAIRTDKIIDVTDYVDNYFESEPTKEAVSGYTVKWDITGNDQLWSDRVKDVDPKRVIIELQSYSELTAYAPVNPLKNGDLAYVVEDNIYYEYDQVEGWIFYSEGQQPIVFNGGEEDYSIKIVPLARSPKYPRYCGCFAPGTYINAQNTVVQNSPGLRVFRVRKQKELNYTGAFSERVPMTYTHNIDPAFGVVNKFSLCLVGQYNLYKQLHQPWLSKLVQADVVKTRVERSKVPADRSLPVRIKSNNYLLREVNNDLNSSDGMVEVKLLKL